MEPTCDNDPWDRIEKLMLTINQTNNSKQNISNYQDDNDFNFSSIIENENLFESQNTEIDQSSILSDEVNVISTENWKKNKLMKNEQDNNINNLSVNLPTQSLNSNQLSMAQDKIETTNQEANIVESIKTSIDASTQVSSTSNEMISKDSPYHRPSSELRLFQELSALQNPIQSGKELIQKILHVARTFSDHSYSNFGLNKISTNHVTVYISCMRLADVFVSMGVHMTDSEVEQLSAGFCSDETGCISATELCELIDEMLYKIMRNLQYKKHQSSITTTTTTNQKPMHLSETDENNKIYQLLIQLCDEFMKPLKQQWSDINKISALSDQLIHIQKQLVRPFIEYDIRRTGQISSENFHTIFTALFPVTTKHQSEAVTMISNRYSVKFDSTKISRSATTTTQIKYRPFLKSLMKVIAQFLTSNGGTDCNVIVHTSEFMKDGPKHDMKCGLVNRSDNNKGLNEFAIVHRLLIQLEAMQSHRRRHCLITLHSHINQSIQPHIDEHTFAQMLIEAGLTLGQEDSIIVSDYCALTSMLIQAGAGNWVYEERAISSKIVQAMSVTLPQRRHWLNLLQQDLELCRDTTTTTTKSSTKVQESATADATYATANAGIVNISDKIETSRNYQKILNSVSPAQFLSCLRKRQVELTPAQEATLIDCLDLETIAHPTSRSVYSGSSSIECNPQLPAINYQLFLQYCDRYCGYEHKKYPNLHPSQEYTAVLSKIAEFLTTSNSLTVVGGSYANTKEVSDDVKKMKRHSISEKRESCISGNQKLLGRDRLLKLLSRLELFANSTTTTESILGRSYFHVPLKDFQTVLATCGLSLTNAEVALLAKQSTTDQYTPSHTVSTIVFTDALRISDLKYMNAADPSPSSASKKGWDSKIDDSPVTIACTTRRSEAIEFMKQSIQIERERCGRTASEWRTDICTLFEGCNAFDTELITCDEFIDCFDIVNIPIKTKWCSDIAIDKNRHLIAFRVILNELFIGVSALPYGVSSQKEISPRRVGRRSNNDNHRIQGSSIPATRYTDIIRRLGPRRSNELGLLQLSVRHLVTEVSRFINARYSVDPKEKVISSGRCQISKQCYNDRLNVIWTALLETFKRYDIDGQCDMISDRDFYMTVSLFININDDSLLAGQNWHNIISFYGTTTHSKSNPKAVLIDYIKFCMHVMDCVSELQPIITTESNAPTLSPSPKKIREIEKSENSHADSSASRTGMNSRTNSYTTKPILKSQKPSSMPYVSDHKFLPVYDVGKTDRDESEEKEEVSTVFKFKGLLNSEHVTLRPKRLCSSTGRDRTHEANVPIRCSIYQPNNTYQNINNSDSSLYNNRHDERHRSLTLLKRETASLSPPRKHSTSTAITSSNQSRSTTPVRVTSHTVTTPKRVHKAPRTIVSVTPTVMSSASNTQEVLPRAARKTISKHHSQLPAHKLSSKLTSKVQIEPDYYDTKKPFLSRKEVRQSLKNILTKVHATVTARSAGRLDTTRAYQLQEFITKAYSEDELKVLQEIRYEILIHLDRAMKTCCVNSDMNTYDNIFDFFIDKIDDYMEHMNDGRIPSDFITCKDLFCLFQKEFFVNTKRMFETGIRQRILDTLESMGRKKKSRDNNDVDIIEMNITDIINLVFSHVLNTL